MIGFSFQLDKRFMFDLTSIRKMNQKAASAREYFRARQLNRPKGHAKDVEKGRVEELSSAGRLTK